MFSSSVEDYQVALATYRAAVERWPGTPITLRQGARVIEDSRRLRLASWSDFQFHKRCGRRWCLPRGVKSRADFRNDDQWQSSLQIVPAAERGPSHLT